MRNIRPLSWVIIVINVIFVWWLVAGVGGAVKNSCTGLTGDSFTVCQGGTAVGAGIGAFLIVFLWALVDVILLVIFLVTNKRGRECPTCGKRVKAGKTECASCGHNFRQMQSS